MISHDLHDLVSFIVGFQVRVIINMRLYLQCKSVDFMCCEYNVDYDIIVHCPNRCRITSIVGSWTSHTHVSMHALEIHKDRAFTNQNIPKGPVLSTGSNDGLGTRPSHPTGT